MKAKPDNSKSDFGIWEIDIVPEAIFGAMKPNGEPLDMVIVAHKESYFIINTKIFVPEMSMENNVISAFEEALSKGPMIVPETIEVRKQEVVDFLQATAKKHKVEIKLVKRLKAVPEIVRSMRQMRNHKEVRQKNIDDSYYDAMDAILANKPDVAIEMLTEALEMDPHYVQTHVGLSLAYRELGDLNKYRKHTIEGYKETCKLFKNWPKELSWYHMENRKYHRAIFFRANLYIDDNEINKGMDLFRDLLRMWPNDNQGVRYFAAGVYAGKSIQEVNDMWDKCNDNQNWDKMEKMLIEQNKKHHFWKMPKEE